MCVPVCARPCGCAHVGVKVGECGESDQCVCTCVCVQCVCCMEVVLCGRMYVKVGVCGESEQR
jgi:hypothetical protein